MRLPEDERAVISQKEFRDAASQFVTGVTVVTTLASDDTPLGLTVNSFSTVSLDPPLVLFCLGRDSDAFEAFDDGNGFVVHVLASDQEAVSRKFATKGIDKFADGEWDRGMDGLPVLRGALATFQCEMYRSYSGGDHTINIGLVRELSIGDATKPALAYFRHDYVNLAGGGS